jgi:site-specific DNA recombinase
MTTITINSPDDVEQIIDCLNAMPMTRKHGKGLLALVPSQRPEKPAVIYMRVSSAKQAVKGKGSLPEQLRSTWDEIVKRGATVTHVYVDVCTAANRDRWAFNLVLGDIRANKIQLLGCWHSSRLVRTQIAAGELEEAIESRGKSAKKIEMFAVNDTLDTELLGILAWAGRWERKAFKERSLMGRQAAISQGRPPNSTPPFWIEGKRIDEETYVYTLKPIAEKIKWAAEAYAAGMGSTEIVKRLNNERVPRATGQTKYGWTRQYLAQVLHYSALKGKWGPFWEQYVDVPALIDEETWDIIQQRMTQNNNNTGRPAKHFVALRGILWCSECGQKMNAHARDWDYVYHVQKDGTKKRYRAQKQELKVKYVCGGQQHYAFRCLKPEYVRDKVLFPRVWAKLCDALQNRALLLAGMKSRLAALENADEVEDLKRIEARLQKTTQYEMSYAEQRAEGIISKEVHAELMMRLREEQRELEQEYDKLLNKVGVIREAREQLDAAHLLVQALPQILGEVSRQEQEQLIMALIDRIEVNGSNQVSINLRLDPAIIRSLPSLRPGSSPLPESPHSNDSQRELSGSSIESGGVLIGHKVTAAL